MRYRPPRILVGVLFAALVLVPVAESAHDHGDLARGTACVACVLAHHSPASGAAAVAIEPPRITAVAVTGPVPAAPAPALEPACPGRAPPPPASSVRV